MKPLNILYFYLFLSITCSAQTFKIGVSRTINTGSLLESLPISGVAINERQYGYQLEMHYLKNIYKDHSISLGIVFAPNRFDFSKSPFSASEKLTSYAIPVLFNFHICQHLILDFGGQVNINQVSPMRNQSTKLYDSSIRIGLNYLFDSKVYLFSYYNLALTSLNDRTFEFGLNSLALGAGYSF